MVVNEAIAGEQYAAKLIEDSLQKADPFTGQRISLKPSVLPAAITAQDFKPLEQEFAKVTARPLKVRYGTATKDVPKQTLISWLRIIQTPGTKNFELVFAPEAVDPVITEWNKEYAVAPGVTQVRLVDNSEASRKVGASGRALKVADVKAQLAAWVKSPSGEPIALASQVLYPTVVTSRTYSQSSAGLQAKLTYWLQTNPGDYQVAIRELGGQGREASYNVLQQTVMASTYKTFLAFVAYKQAENNSLSLTMALHGSRNVEQCIEFMIVNSDNDCAIALGRHIGWAKVDQVIAAAGFSGVKLNNYDAQGRLSGDKLVNAREQANFLAQLSEGVLINGGNTAKLLGYMHRQVYREGIPAGSRGVQVADKVGFLEGYLHDVGIAYAPKATYALVIMSKGSSWSNISSLSQAIYDFMNE